MFAVLVLAGGLFAFSRYHASMDYYEKPILIAAMAAGIGIGWFWRPLRVLDRGGLRVAARYQLLPGRPGARRQRLLAQVLPVQPVGHPLDERAVLHEHVFYWIGFFGGRRATRSAPAWPGRR